MATFTGSITAAADDVYCFSDGTNALVTDGCGVGKWQEYSYSSGLRFQNVTVPYGAIISSATLTFISSWTEQGINLKSKIIGEITNDPDVVSSYTDFWNRVNSARTTNEVLWDISVPWPQDASFTSPNLASVIQDIVNTSGWVSGNAMNLFWLDNGSSVDLAGLESNRGAYCYEVDPSKVPVLNIVYTIVTPGVLDVSISETGDDAGIIYDTAVLSVTGWDHTNIKIGALASSTDAYGAFFRFQNVTIEQYSNVNSATLNLTCNNIGATGAGGIYMQVKAEASDDASQLPAYSEFWVRQRIESWQYFYLFLPAWVVDQEYNFSIDLRSLVQEIINRPGWVSGNSIQFFIEYWSNSFDTWRQVYSYENDPTKAARLHVEYDPPSSLGEFKSRTNNPYSDETYYYNGGTGAFAVYPYFSYGTIGRTGVGINTSYGAYLRWIDVLIPKGSKITSSSVLFRSSESLNSPGVKVKIQGLDADQANVVYTLADWNSFPKTTASVDWNIDEAWNSGTDYESIDISSVLQEIVDRDGWVEGTSLGLFLSDNTSNDSAYRQIGLFDYDARYSPMLQVSFTPPSASSLRRTINSSLDDGWCVEVTTVTGRRNHVWYNGYGGAYSTLQLGRETTSQVGKHIGLKFNDIQIEKGSVVSAAYIALTSYGPGTGTSFNVQISADKSANSSYFTSGYDYVDRKLNKITNSKVAWPIVSDWGWNNTVVTPNLKSIVQEIIDLTDWAEGNSINFMLSYNDTAEGMLRNFVSYDTNLNHDYSAELFVYFTEPTPPSFRISSGADDSMIWIHPTDTSKNGFDVNGDAISFGTQGDLDYHAAFRFQGIRIPQGSTITNAYLTFTSEPGQANIGINVELNIKADSEIDAAAISSFDDFKTRLSRTTTANVDWTVISSWLDDTAHSSIDISSVIQELITNDGWAYGNPILLLVTTKDTNVAGNIRSVYSYDKDKSKQVQLVIDYSSSAYPWKDWLKNEMIPQKDKELGSLNQSVNSVAAQKTKWQHWKAIYEGIQAEATTNLESRLGEKVTSFETYYFPSGTYDSIAVVYGGTYGISNISDWEIHGYLSSSGADDVIYVYESTGWDSDPTIKKSVEDWATTYPLIHNTTWGASRMVINLTTAQGIVTPWRDSTQARNPMLDDYKD